MMSNTRRTLRPALALAIASTLAVGLPALTGCEQQTAQSDAASVNLAAAEIRDFEITTLATGELEARDRVELRSDVERQTTIVEIVPEGSRVKAGEVLVRLNADEIKNEVEEEELQLSEARLNLESAETAVDIQLSDNKASLRKAELAVQLAELALQQWENGDKIKQLKQLETAIERTERDLERLREKKEKSVELHARRFISDDELKQDQIALLEAEAAAETAKLDKEVYETYQMKRDHEQMISDLEEARQELERVKKSNQINLKSRESSRANRAVQVARREERLAEERAQLEACTLVAPTDGLVVYGSTIQSDNWRSQSEGPISVGRQVRNNDLIIALPDTSEMIASVKVHESLAGRIRAGQRASIKVDALSELTIPGTVESVGLLAETGGWRDPNRREYTVRVRVEPGPYSDDLKPSMRCQAELVLGTVENALTVPVQAIFSDGAVRYVLVPEDGKFARRPVQVGRRSDLYAQITSGLEEGERVLLRDPRPGEVIDEPWDTEELTASGYQLDEEGNPISERRMMASRRGGGRSGDAGSNGSGNASSAQRGGRRGSGSGETQTEEASSTEQSGDDASIESAQAEATQASAGAESDAESSVETAEGQAAANRN